MIRWACVLTEGKIAILMALKKRVYGEPFSGVTNYAAAANGLLRDGLIEEYKDEERNRSGHFLTERGRILLAYIEQDFERVVASFKRKAR